MGRTRREIPLFLLLVLTLSAQAGKHLEGIACRSVHLGYPAPEGVAFYNEMTVDASAAGTYFMVCGFGKGYFGIQELGNGKKVVLFSVWDPGSQNNPNSVAKEERVGVLHHEPDVRVKRFGGEGTGGQSFFDYEWKKGQTYRFLVRARSNGTRTAFSGYFYIPETGKWKHLVTFDTLAGSTLLNGYYSFVEDFRRNRESTQHVRKAHFGNGWIQDKRGDWQPILKARFTGDGNPVMNIDAGTDGTRFFLATGGDTSNTHTPLWEHMTREGEGAPPLDLP